MTSTSYRQAQSIAEIGKQIPRIADTPEYERVIVCLQNVSCYGQIAFHMAFTSPRPLTIGEEV